MARSPEARPPPRSASRPTALPPRPPRRSSPHPAMARPAPPPPPPPPPGGGLPSVPRARPRRGISELEIGGVKEGFCSLRLRGQGRAGRNFQRALRAEPGLLAARVQLARLSIERGDDQQARRHFKVILASGYAASQDYALAVDIERRLGDRDAERSIAAQWKRLFPESPQLQAYLRSDINER